LKADGLAAAGGENAQSVVSAQDGLDDALLGGPEVVIAEVLPEEAAGEIELVYEGSHGPW
jgi:hypothetical protein